MPDDAESAIVEESINVAATPENLNAVHAALDRFWPRAEASGEPTPDETGRGEFVTAVGEIAANIIRHAYAGRPNGRYRLRYLFYPGRVEARFYDWGDEFHELDRQPAELPADPLEIAEGGYGLPMARAMLDALEYDRSGANENRWRLVKLFAND
jgi:anti-sigma regulatory factor (Ser/Thr protein kinase)